MLDLDLVQEAVDAARAAGSGFYSVALISALGPIAVAALGYINHRKGKARDQGQKSELEQLLTTISNNHLETTQQFNTISLELVELRGVVGNDAGSGMRGEVGQIRGEVKGLVDRERDRLEAKAYDRRRTGPS